MKLKNKIYLKLNLMSLFFIVVSFISVTLAWFAYSGLSKFSTEMGVKAWYIDLTKDGKKVSNDIVISLSEIYPGMETVNEIVNVKNSGDSDAIVKYSITSARILDNSKDNYTINESTSSEYVEDILSHDYPFHINMSLQKNYILAGGDESSFEVSVSWPLDSNTDALDSAWGNDAFQFQQSEESKKTSDQNYQIRPSIQIVISLTAEQYIGDDSVSDPSYNLGDMILYDPVNNKGCQEVGNNCISTYVIDENNKLNEQTVNLLPNPKNSYFTGKYNEYNSLFNNAIASWSVTSRPLLATDILKVISTNIIDSTLVRENLSDSIIGKLNYENRIGSEISKAINYNGYYKYNYEKFDYLTSAKCYWTNSTYNSNKTFAVKKIDENFAKVYGEDLSSNCNVIPVIVASKININSGQ